MCPFCRISPDCGFGKPCQCLALYRNPLSEFRRTTPISDYSPKWSTILCFYNLNGLIGAQSDVFHRILTLRHEKNLLIVGRVLFSWSGVEVVLQSRFNFCSMGQSCTLVGFSEGRIDAYTSEWNILAAASFTSICRTM